MSQSRTYLGWTCLHWTLTVGKCSPPKDFNLKIVTRGSILANQLAIPSFYREEIQQMSQALWAERAVDYQCLARWQRESHSWRLRAICCKAGSCALCRQEFHDRTLPHKSTQKWCTCNFPKPSGFVSSRCQCAAVLLGTSLAMGIELLKLSSMCWSSFISSAPGSMQFLGYYFGCFRAWL